MRRCLLCADDVFDPPYVAKRDGNTAVVVESFGPENRQEWKMLRTFGFSMREFLGKGKLAVVAVAATLALAESAKAAMMNGSFAVTVSPFVASTASYTASSFNLSAANLVTSGEMGTFATDVPALSDLTASITPITGLSSSPTSDAINSYFLFSSPDSTFATSGTTPVNRFEFNLATVTTLTSNAFSGTGTLVDLYGTYDPSPAEFTLSFSGPNTYSFTVATVPEPTTISLVAISLSALGLRRRRA
jgi:PEP-CTERM motif